MSRACGARGGSHLDLRDPGRIVAAIVVMRPAGSPDLSVAEAGALRRAHPVFEGAIHVRNLLVKLGAANRRQAMIMLGVAQPPAASRNLDGRGRFLNGVFTTPDLP
jgi:hypothetical protein